MTGEWEWDKTLYAGTAAHYLTGRRPYPAELAGALRSALELDGTGRLLDVGCGPGSLTLLIAPLMERAIGIDADPDMVGYARQMAGEAGIGTVDWYQMRAEELPGGLGTFRLITFAQSFHWLDRSAVAGVVQDMLQPGGACVIVYARMHRGDDSEDSLGYPFPMPYPRPPHEAIDELVARYLGPVRRAGLGTLPAGLPQGDEDVMGAAGFDGPDRIEVGGGAIWDRSEDELVASVFSLSSAAPGLFGDQLAEFERELRGLLRAKSGSGRFSERAQAIELDIWRPAAPASG